MNGVSLRFRFLLTTLMAAAPNRGLTYSQSHRIRLAEYQLDCFFFSFGKQFHYPLHGEKTRIGPEAAAGPVSNSRGEYPNRCWPALWFHGGPRPATVSASTGHA